MNKDESVDVMGCARQRIRSIRRAEVMRHPAAVNET